MSVLVTTDPDAVSSTLLGSAIDSGGGAVEIDPVSGTATILILPSYINYYNSTLTGTEVEGDDSDYAEVLVHEFTHIIAVSILGAGYENAAVGSDPLATAFAAAAAAIDAALEGTTPSEGAVAAEYSAAAVEEDVSAALKSALKESLANMMEDFYRWSIGRPDSPFNPDNYNYTIKNGVWTLRE